MSSPASSAVVWIIMINVNIVPVLLGKKLISENTTQELRVKPININVQPTPLCSENYVTPNLEVKGMIVISKIWIGTTFNQHPIQWFSLYMFYSTWNLNNPLKHFYTKQSFTSIYIQFLIKTSGSIYFVNYDN